MNQQLLKAFKKSKWTAYKLEQISGVSYSTLSRWKRGETDLSISNAEKIAAALGCRFELIKSE